MIGKKVFILSFHKAETDLLKENLFRAAGDLKLNLKVDVYSERPGGKIPSGYEIYFLHLSQIGEPEEIRNLRERQAESYICGLAGATYCFLNVKEDKFFGRMPLTNWFDYENLKRVLEERSKAC
jgi:hypothetical protein